MIRPAPLQHAYRIGQRIFHWFNPAARRRIVRWETADGVAFFRNLPLEAGQVVVDFGSGPGHYSVPAALVAGATGLVCAVDQNGIRRRRLVRRARALGLQNIRTVAQLDEVAAVLADRPCDVVLAYDVLHFFLPDERQRLYDRFRALLRPGGLFSVHPKHLRHDGPSRAFAQLGLEDVIAEITAAGFQPHRALDVTLWHDHGPLPGTILNFVTPEQTQRS